MRPKVWIGIATFAACAGGRRFVGYIASRGSGSPRRESEGIDNVADINNIAVDSNVLLRGVPVGKVTQLEAFGRVRNHPFLHRQPIPSAG